MSLSQAQVIGRPKVKTWDDYEQGCLAAFSGGYRSAEDVETFQHGMRTVFNLLRNEFPPAELCRRMANLYFAGKQQAAEREAAIVAAGNVPSDMDYGLTENEIAAGAMLNALATERDELFGICCDMKDDIDSVFIDPEEMSASWTGIYKRLKDVIAKAETH